MAIESTPSWLHVERDEAPLLVSLPHTGTEIPADIEGRFVSPWLARKDADWWVDRLYEFARGMGATVVRTAIARTVVDVNRDPSGASLYPGQQTTGLCPLTTFDGEALYRPGQEPDEPELARRVARWFDPYHAALAAELARLRARHGRVVLYDSHSIRSRLPFLFAGELPHCNIGTNSGASCARELQEAIAGLCAVSSFSYVVNGRFKGGWITRSYGRPQDGVHAVQMELACRSYMNEPAGSAAPESWPGSFDGARAEPMRALLTRVLEACLAFARAAER